MENQTDIIQSQHNLQNAQNAKQTGKNIGCYERNKIMFDFTGSIVV